MRLSVRAHDLGTSDLWETVARARELNLDGVQLVAYKIMPELRYLPGAIKAEKAREIGNAFRMNGLGIPLIGAYFNPAHNDPAEAEKGERIFADYLRASAALGSSFVGSETGAVITDKAKPFYPENRTDRALDKVVQSFARLCDVASGCGASVAIEGAFWHTCYDVKRLAEARNRIDRGNLKIIFDLFNFMDASNIEARYEILEEGLRTFGTDIIAFHVKDCVLEGGRLKQIPVGTGQGLFDWGRILESIRTVNPEAELVLEGTTGGDLVPAITYIRSLGL